MGDDDLSRMSMNAHQMSMVVGCNINMKSEALEAYLFEQCVEMKI